VGHDILDFIHPCDHDELQDMLSDPCHAEQQRVIYLRMKCTLTNTGRNINIKSAGYKVCFLQVNNKILLGIAILNFFQTKCQKYVN